MNDMVCSVCQIDFTKRESFGYMCYHENCPSKTGEKMSEEYKQGFKDGFDAGYEKGLKAQKSVSLDHIGLPKSYYKINQECKSCTVCGTDYGGACYNQKCPRIVFKGTTSNTYAGTMMEGSHLQDSGC